jgi:hypothetical protein
MMLCVPEFEHQGFGGISCLHFHGGRGGICWVVHVGFKEDGSVWNNRSSGQMNCCIQSQRRDVLRAGLRWLTAERVPAGRAPWRDGGLRKVSYKGSGQKTKCLQSMVLSSLLPRPLLGP